MTLEHFKYVKPKDSISNFCWRPPPFDTIETGLLGREGRFRCNFGNSCPYSELLAETPVHQPCQRIGPVNLEGILCPQLPPPPEKMLLWCWGKQVSSSSCFSSTCTS